MGYQDEAGGVGVLNTSDTDVPAFWGCLRPALWESVPHPGASNWEHWEQLLGRTCV